MAMTGEEIVNQAFERVCGFEEANIDSMRRALHGLNPNHLLEVMGRLRQEWQSSKTAKILVPVWRVYQERVRQPSMSIKGE